MIGQYERGRVHAARLLAEMYGHQTRTPGPEGLQITDRLNSATKLLGRNGSSELAGRHG